MNGQQRNGSKRQANGLWWIFKWPLVIGAASVVGLVSALIGDQLYDVLSWAALGLTLPVIGAAWRGVFNRQADDRRRTGRNGEEKR